MADPVAESLLEYRKDFPALEECVHFISHSLGCVPARATDDLMEFLELWRTKSITAWGDWLPEVDRAAARISKIISAPEGTVIMHQNVSTIMSVLASCVDYAPARNRIAANVPSPRLASVIGHRPATAPEAAIASISASVM